MRRFRAVVHGLVSLAALLGLLGGVPAALVHWGRLPDPPSGDWWQQLTDTVVTDTMLYGVLTVAAWVAWMCFAASVVVEAVAGIRGVSAPHVTLAGPLQRLARALVVPVLIALSFTQHHARADAPPPGPLLASTSVATLVVDVAESPASVAASDPRPVLSTGAASADPVEVGDVIVVQRVDNPWAFAERHLGDGMRWRELWHLNRGVVQPDGRAWTDPQIIEAGWQLRLPAGATATGGAVAAPVPATQTERPSEAAVDVGAVVDQHVVVDGDSYWAIARARLGIDASRADVARYTTALMNLNAPVLGYDDPEMLHPGDVVSIIDPATVTDADAASGDADVLAAVAVGVPHHVVVDGDSYWQIATERAIELHGPDGALSTVVYDLHLELIDLNAPRLGYEDREMIHPGDVVFFVDPATYVTSAPTPQTAPAPLPPPVVDEPTPEPAVPDAAPAEAPDTGHVEVDATPPVEPSGTPAVSVPIAGPDDGSEDAGDDDGGVRVPAAVLGLSALATAGTAGLFVARRRRAARSGRPHQRPAHLPADSVAAVEALLFADTADVTWLALELRWLAHHCPPHVRASLRVEEIQVGTDRDVEIAFSATPVDGPPAGWSMAAERVWQLDHPHSPDELAAFVDLPPLLPALVTLGRYDGGLLYVNLENHPGVNVTGDPTAVVEWVTGVVWELAGGAFAEHPSVLVVGADLPGLDRLDAVEVVTADAARARFAAPPPDAEPAMFERRANQWDGWDTTVVVLGPTADDEWAQVAARPDVGVIALDGGLPDALGVRVEGGKVAVAAWGLELDAVGLTSRDAARVGALLRVADAEPVTDELTIPTVPVDTPPGDDSHDASEESWEAPSAPIVVRLLAETPRVDGPDGELRVKPQPLAALAYLASRRQVSLDDLRSAIWGDDQPVKQHRIRDLLSELRKQLGGAGALRHVDDGVVRIGPDLICDLTIFEALARRAVEVPAEAEQRLGEMLDLVSGRPFNYPASASAYWRWVDLDYLAAVWEHRVATAACELAQWHLTRNEPDAAIEVVTRGLQADPLSGPLTEVLMTAYAAAGAVDTAQHVFDAHDRALADRDLGGASDETRRVLDDLRTAGRPPAA